MKNAIVRVTPLLVDKYLFVEIETADGFVGTGEAGAWSHIEATYTVLKKFADYLVSRDAENIEHHWQTLKRFGSYSGSIIMAALSAIDIALWDIKAQRNKEPIFSLLGGAYRSKVRVYGHARGTSQGQLLDRCKNLKDAGFTAIGHVNPFLDEDIVNPLEGSYADGITKALETLEVVREAIGKDTDLCVEIHRRLKPAEAIAFGRKIEHLNPLFYEDPIRPGSASTMAQVQAHVGVPVATGERLFALEQFNELLQIGAVRYLRPCIALCGGFTGMKKIAALAEAYDVDLIPHNTYSPIATTASLHLAASIPNLLILEFPTAKYTDDFASTDLVASELTSVTLRQVNGFLPLNEGPGLGTALIPSASSKFPFRPIDVAMRLRADGSPTEH
ncbi:mandelate racemase/muconate lactonizing enzyme family protein [Brucella pseudogrignonensis]|uniref:mandelate racemase/muconate lactonizing enzyme family protein n=1 Tax=Brucella pseudogrignonensis TaxID=419475 RepID=UPI003ED0C7C5